ncbi:MAG: hypothetical protein LBD10_02990 [Desulfobulbus sp.]|jgi:hypothetical protein|uniref:hypothetical protein n=1 Tax=Desulfobulbus sp. TaxID=895 RepID=UPI0028493B92|nr:hypothetical protein [Desulfobulbus sp.]MDR2549156.1 hypothetical protein [Desulfobulbus sp.]
MQRLLIRFVIITVLIVTMLLAANIAHQHFYCKTPWNECAPAAFVPCEPVNRVMDQWNDYQEMARKHGQGK